MQLYDSALGFQGNIEKCLQELQEIRNTLKQEVVVREITDAQNIEFTEQHVTDLYLDNIEAQQEITELQLSILED